MILDKESKDMLDLLLTSKPDSPRNSFSYDYICEISGIPEDDMFPIIKNLVKTGFAEYAYRVSSSGRKDAGIALTQVGLKYKEINRLERRERWKERIAGFCFGVASSVIAAIIIKLTVG